MERGNMSKIKVRNKEKMNEIKERKTTNQKREKEKGYLSIINKYISK